MKGGKTKTVWIVDGAYLFKSAASHGRFDYLQLKIELQKEVEAMFSESYYFNSQGSSTSQAQEGFNKWLRSAAPSGPQMTTKFRKLRTTRQRCPSCGELFEREMQMGRRHRHSGHDLQIDFSKSARYPRAVRGRRRLRSRVGACARSRTRDRRRRFPRDLLDQLAASRQPRHLARGSLGENQKRFAHARRRFRVFRAGRPRFATGDENLL